MDSAIQTDLTTWMTQMGPTTQTAPTTQTGPTSRTSRTGRTTFTGLTTWMARRHERARRPGQGDPEELDVPDGPYDLFGSSCLSGSILKNNIFFMLKMKAHELALTHRAFVGFLALWASLMGAFFQCGLFWP